MVESTHSGRLWPSLYEPFARMGSRISDWLSPPSDASSDDKAYRITVELPGVAEGDVALDVHDGLMTLKGEKREEKEESGDTWYFSERSYGSFSRSFRLPADADGDAAGASLKDGVLTVTIPKREEPKGNKRVKIEKS